MSCQPLQTDRTFYTLNGDKTVTRKELGFSPKLIVIDNMSNAEVFLYDGSYANPIGQNIIPLDVVPARCFKIINVPDGKKSFTLAWEAGDFAGEHLIYVLSEDLSYANSYHQQINPVNVSVQLSGSSALGSGTLAATVAAAPLAADHPCSEVIVQNAKSSTVPILIGGADLQLIEIAPGEWMTIPAQNVNLVYAKTGSGTATVNWLARK